MSKNLKSKIRVDKAGEEKISELIDLAHQGSQQSIEKLSEIIKTAKDEGLKATAKIAKEEAEYFYYSPENNQEEKDLLLMKMIRDREDSLIMDLESRAGAAKFELEKLDIEREVHQELLKVLPEDKQKDWQYNFSEDYYTTVAGRLQEIEADIEYENRWLEMAKKLIKTKKYFDLPPDFFQHYHWDYEDTNFWSDNDFADLPDEPEEPPF